MNAAHTAESIIRAALAFTVVATLVIYVGSCGIATGATYHVERDGSGDFIEFQAAVDAALSGDTIQLGPGRWDLVQSHTTPAGWTTDVCVVIVDKSLVILGAGPGVSFVGPSELPPFSFPGPMALMVYGDNDLIIRDMTLTNMRDGLYFSGVDMTAENVEIHGCEIGTSTLGSGTHLYLDCRFVDNRRNGIFGTAFSSNLVLRNCSFDAAYGGHVSIMNVDDVVIDGCEFQRGLYSAQFDGSSCRATVQNCTIRCGTFGITAYNGTRLTLTDNEFFGGRDQLGAVNSAHVTGSGNVFHGADDPEENLAAIACYTGSTLDLHGNHILRGRAPFAVLFDSFTHPDQREQHLENNYWGTASADSVAAWVWDESDDPGLNIRTFLAPFHGQPVGNEELSFGELKRLFR